MASMLPKVCGQEDRGALADEADAERGDHPRQRILA